MKFIPVKVVSKEVQHRSSLYRGLIDGAPKHNAIVICEKIYYYNVASNKDEFVSFIKDKFYGKKPRISFIR